MEHPNHCSTNDYWYHLFIWAMVPWNRYTFPSGPKYYYYNWPAFFLTIFISSPLEHCSIVSHFFLPFSNFGTTKVGSIALGEFFYKVLQLWLVNKTLLTLTGKVAGFFHELEHGTDFGTKWNSWVSFNGPWVLLMKFMSCSFYIL